MTYVYVLRSKPTGHYYIGISSNPIKRLQQHNSGHSISTKAYAPWDLLCAVPYDSREEAAAAEQRLKAAKSRRVIEKYIAQSVESRRILDSPG
ncbi:MAG: GIY-YIG nuclease family protein [Candidatus Neomarinimicrobiota bacterium]